MPPSRFDYSYALPEPALADFVEYFWVLENYSGESKEIVVLPDGGFDVFFGYSANEPFHVTLSGITTESSQTALAGGTVMYAISFKFLALEYILYTSVADLLNSANYLPDNFLDIHKGDLINLETFQEKVSLKLKACIQQNVDTRKRKLSQLIYDSKGSISIQDASDRCGWSSRQINRYFQQWIGISLKNYLTILRFRASFLQIKAGKLFPEQHYADQAHFIREVKKFAGVVPKELNQNKNDRFIQFSILKKK
jgi:AraC-like DNA-binding protein